MGTPHPKALRAASQEAWPNTGQTLGNVEQARYDRSNVGAIFAKFRSEMTHIWQGAGKSDNAPARVEQGHPENG
jgi:hypothetical protein